MSSDHSFISENIILFCFLLIFANVIAQLLYKYNVTWMPASASQIILGFLIGLIVYLISHKEAEFLMFRSDIFFFVLLPPIVFEAGYSMKRTNFFRNVGSILLFAFVGTVISTFVIGFGLYGLAYIDWVDIDKESALDPLTFGALISSIDPIATLAILGNKQLRCDPMLYSLVFGESVLNDAVSITLYQTFISFRKQATFGGADYAAAVAKFCMVSVGSVIVGVAIGLFTALLLRQVNFSKKPSTEFIIIFFGAYACYCTAELLHLSGIMALFITGVVQAHYAWYNISSVSRTTTRHAFHAFAHITETLLYVYFGISALFSCIPHFDFEWSYKLIIWSAVLCVLGRAVNIFPLAFLANLGRKKKISMKMQLVMWFSGLRGAISFALAISMDSPTPGSKKFITTTMILIVVSTLGMGGSSTWLLNKLGMTGTDGDDENEDEHGNEIAGSVPPPVVNDYNQMGDENEPRSTNEPARKKRCPDMHVVWRKFDKSYMQPLFGGRHAEKIPDYSAEEHGHDNVDMVNPYLMPEVQSVFAANNTADDEAPQGTNDEEQNGGTSMEYLQPYDNRLPIQNRTTSYTEPHAV